MPCAINLTANIFLLNDMSSGDITLKNNAAVNPFITVGDSPDVIVHRIAGVIEEPSFALSNNFALESMHINGKTVNGSSELDGTNKTDEQFKRQSTYEDKLGWGFGANDENPWNMDENNTYPYLYWEKR